MVNPFSERDQFISLFISWRYQCVGLNVSVIGMN